MNTRTLTTLLAAATTSLIAASTAHAGAHTWRVNELFSTADGSIQFVELKECCDGDFEVFVGGLQVTSQSTGQAFTFPGNLQSPTGLKHILLATQSFANLPGAPTPDHIIPPNFFNPAGDTVRYHVYDSLAFTAGQLPTDCVNSLTAGVGSGTNSPTNFSNQSGSVDACPSAPCPADVAPAGGNGNVNVDDLLAVINSWGPCANPNTCPSDIAPAGGNDVVNVDDLLAVINGWGPCK